MTDILVAGEPARTLLEAFEQIEFTPRSDGTVSGKFALEPRLGDPFARAMMRVEAELLLDDADHCGHPGFQERTHPQRAADAFIASALRVADAVSSAP